MLRNHSNPSNMINLAAFCPQTRTHGPGLRSVVWVQGCPFHCPGCIAPEWQMRTVKQLVQVDDLAQRILSQPDNAGLTFSGGEPMLQAAALANLVEKVRQHCPRLNVICFTGYQWAELLSRAALGDTGIERLLSQVDVLIDGPYIEAQNNGRGLRGSTNQVVHRLTRRAWGMDFDFENCPRQVEILVGNGQYLAAGVPPAGILNALDSLSFKSLPIVTNKCRGTHEW